MRRSIPWLSVSLALAGTVAACDSAGSGSKKKDATSAGDTAGKDATSGADGGLDGAGDGSSDGTSDGSTDGTSDGASDGSTDGTSDGASDGSTDGGGSCLDQTYQEPLPDTSVSLKAELASYDSNNPAEFILAVLRKRYPLGAHIVEGGLKYQGQNCIDSFLGDRGSGEDVITQLSTIVHECGHLFDFTQSSFGGATYVITDETRFTCEGLSYTGSKAGFARSLLNADDFASKRPPCGGGSASGCDSYADIYLSGDPEDSQFDSGDQGFDTVLEETVQYVNSLACGYAYSDFYGQFSVSERDGIATFLWYVERYLHLARTEHPDVYQTIVTDPCWRDAILTVWGRAWLYLDATKGNVSLGLEDAAILELVADPVLMDEIQRIRAASSCL